MLNKILSYSTPILLVVILLLQIFGGGNQSLGGTTNYDQLDVTDGYYVDGTARIDGSGIGQFVTVNATNHLASSTNIGTDTTATSTITHNLRWTATSTTGFGIVLRNASGTCNLVTLNNSMNLATTSVSCN